MLHGLGGEDGSVQGLLELLKVPYVGCKILSSSIGMDKIYSKIIFEKAGLNQAKYEYIQKNEENYTYIDKEFNEKTCTIGEICDILDEKLEYPIFVKPSNSGSSVGITKVKTKDKLKNAIKDACQYDSKIIIEQGINAREIECAVLGNEQVVASCLGEILPKEEFYSYDAKYKNTESKTDIPAEIDEEISDKIKSQAIKAFKAISGKGLSRVDFFIENGTQDIYINEINTLPGFTVISMYPKLFKASGIAHKELLDKIINLGLNR